MVAFHRVLSVELPGWQSLAPDVPPLLCELPHWIRVRVVVGDIDILIWIVSERVLKFVSRGGTNGSVSTL
jgi:hypothetical protein